MSQVVSEPLQRLSEALACERRALLEHDVEGLMQAVQAKLEALRELEHAVPQGQQRYLRELAELNRANGALLARRRREVNWALRHLGRSESAPAYDANGQSSTLQAVRPLAIA
ncbi:MAG: hypothetical protein QM581_01960 [Pseudomonas sp.]